MNFTVYYHDLKSKNLSFVFNFLLNQVEQLQIIQLTQIQVLVIIIKEQIFSNLGKQKLIPLSIYIIVFQSKIVIYLMVIIILCQFIKGFLIIRYNQFFLKVKKLYKNLTMQKIFTLDDKIVQIPECSICLLPLNNDLCTIVDCGHVFHKGCVASLKTSGFQQCPVCRVQMKNVCDIFYTIKIKDVQDEPKYMAYMIQIITLKEEIEKLKQSDKDHHEKVFALQKILSRKDLKIQLLRQHNKNQKVKYKDLNSIFISEHNQIIDLYRYFGNIMKNWHMNDHIPNLLKGQQSSNSQSSEQNQSESQDEEEQQSSDQMDQFEDQQNKVAYFFKQLTSLLEDKLKQKKKAEEDKIILQSKSQKKQCLKEIQSFEKTQRQHK
ncbi:unnamed protein product (macronuclear) [Paramecium tetraurelia]|uniref:RING-type domain-containing protein n=1 Tax=Paramecium tetraurelia TaxID=5888 RepID=A0BF07_PARTE|nr:uncharacterized protein GSPATT00028159001 [Paramecium tetraurelia]CAK57124.1 unnamed protein product [Paramecium tetraurelia]|eukprot:XP_001424522.1 hypothetical protein (macronuclear) [Paramecium tetraurelia strain d4-2]